MTTPAPPNRSRPLTWLIAGCAVLFICVLLAGVLGAGFYFLRGRAPTAAATPNVEYVLDASPRMLASSPDGTRLSQAQGVLAEIVRPANTRVSAGLRVFGTGAAGGGAASAGGGCQDTDLLVPLAPANQAKIADRLASVQGGAGVDSALGVAVVSAIRDLAATPGKHALVVVTGGGDSCNPQAGQLVAQEAARQGIDLQLFVVGFEVTDTDGTAIKGVVDQTSGAAYLQADNADQLRRTLTAVQTFVDTPGALTVAQVSATAAVPGSAVTPGATALAGPTPTALNTGLLQLNVLGYAGQPAEVNSRLIVRAYLPQDHQNVLTTDFNNPTALRLPPGQYDLFLTYEVAASSPYIGGEIEAWVTGLTVQPNQTTTTSYDLQLGQVDLTVLEAAGQAPPQDNYEFGYRIFHADNLDNAAASVIVTNTATLMLPPGAYVLEPSYPNIDLTPAQAAPQPFEVKAGQSLAYTFDLKLGHLLLEVDDAAGQPIDAQLITYAIAYLPTDLNASVASVFNTNPLDLPLQTGIAYTVLIKLQDGRQLTLANQRVAEGARQTVKLSLGDFK